VTEDHLTGDDYLLIIEALEAYIAAGRNPVSHERQDYHDFHMLRAKLTNAVGMHHDDNARWWLTMVLLIEREAFSAALTKKIFDLLKDQGLTRRTLRDGLLNAMSACREHQFYKRGARTSPSYHATNPPPDL
jgi:hypothetical protein